MQKVIMLTQTWNQMTTHCKMHCMQNYSKKKMDKKLLIVRANGRDNFKETWWYTDGIQQLD